MALVHKVKPLGGNNPSVIIKHYIYAWSNTYTTDTIVNNDDYKKATIKAISAFNQYNSVNMNLNGVTLPQLAAGEEYEVEINGDAILSGTYTGTDTINLQITLHN